MSSQPESILVVKPFTAYLQFKGWRVEKTHGSAYQSGFPDLYCMHPEYSPRWVECKLCSLKTGTVSFTPAQKVKFPLWIANGVGIWVIASDDLRDRAKVANAYARLFQPFNARSYLCNT